MVIFIKIECVLDYTEMLNKSEKAEITGNTVSNPNTIKLKILNKRRNKQFYPVGKKFLVSYK